MPGRQHAALLLVHGDERHLVDASLQEWRDDLQATQLHAEIFEAPLRLTELHRSIAEMPLIDPERAVIVRDPPQLSSTTMRGADSADAFAALLRDRAPSTSLCIVVHGRVPPSNPVLAAVRELGGTILYHAPVKRGREVRSWLEREVHARKLRLAVGSIDAIVQAAGTDLGALSSELDKLVALSEGKPLALAEVRASLAGDDVPEMWSVVDDLLGGTPPRGAAVLAELIADGRSTQHLLAVLSGQVRDLLLAQAHLNTRGSAAGLAAQLRTPDWRAERLARQARSVPPTVVAGWLRELHEADRRVKLGEVGDQDVLQLFGLRAAAAVSAARAAPTP